MPPVAVPVALAVSPPSAFWLRKRSEEAASPLESAAALASPAGLCLPPRKASQGLCGHSPRRDGLGRSLPPMQPLLEPPLGAALPELPVPHLMRSIRAAPGRAAALSLSCAPCQQAAPCQRPPLPPTPPTCTQAGVPRPCSCCWAWRGGSQGRGCSQPGAGRHPRGHGNGRRVLPVVMGWFARPIPLAVTTGGSCSRPLGWEGGHVSVQRGEEEQGPSGAMPLQLALERDEALLRCDPSRALTLGRRGFVGRGSSMQPCWVQSISGLVHSQPPGFRQRH